jgi:hypothetical protein
VKAYLQIGVFILVMMFIVVLWSIKLEYGL